MNSCAPRSSSPTQATPRPATGSSNPSANSLPSCSTPPAIARTRRQRHLQFYGDLARTSRDHQDKTGQVPLEPLLRELGNLRVALDWAQAAPDTTEAGLRLAADMFSVWTGAAHHAEGVARLVGLLDSGHGSPHARSRAAVTAAIMAGHRGRLGPHSPWSAGHDDQAIALCEQALHEARRGADDAQERWARHILTQILMDRGDIDAAARRQLAATPTGSEQTSETDAGCIITDAWFDIIVADLDKATTRLQQVVTGPYRNAFWIGTAARWFLGEVMLERGDHDRARSWIAEALVLGETNGDPDAIIDAHLELVIVECAAGHRDAADAHFRVATQLRQNTNPLGDLPFLEARAALALNSTSPGDALALAEAALALANDTASRAPSMCLFAAPRRRAGRGRRPRPSLLHIRPADRPCRCHSCPLPSRRRSRGRRRSSPRPRQTAGRPPAPRRSHQDPPTHQHTAPAPTSNRQPPRRTGGRAHRRGAALSESFPLTSVAGTAKRWRQRRTGKPGVVLRFAQPCGVRGVTNRLLTRGARAAHHAERRDGCRRNYMPIWAGSDAVVGDVRCCRSALVLIGSSGAPSDPLCGRGRLKMTHRGSSISHEARPKGAGPWQPPAVISTWSTTSCPRVRAARTASAWALGGITCGCA